MGLFSYLFASDNTRSIMKIEKLVKEVEEKADIYTAMSDEELQDQTPALKERLKNGETQEFKTKLIGKHHVENIAGAIAVANRLGISLEELTYAVKTLEAVPHRLELVKGTTATIIDDAYNSNSECVKSASNFVL